MIFGKNTYATSSRLATRPLRSDTMVPDAYVNHIPVLTGGVGREQLRQFYSRHFIPKMPADTEIAAAPVPERSAPAPATLDPAPKRPVSERRLAANRANSKKSTGPRTP